MENLEQEAAKLVTKAIAVEKNGLNTYLNYALQTKEESGKNIFILLARDEYDHMNLLENMLKELRQEEDVDMPEDVDLTIIEKVVPKLRKKDLSTVGKAGIDEMMALRTALKMERDSIEYYQNLRERLKDEQMRKIAHRLVEMEEGHYDIIQMQIDSVTNTGFWFDIPEFSLEKA